MYGPMSKYVEGAAVQNNMEAIYTERYGYHTEQYGYHAKRKKISF